MRTDRNQTFDTAGNLIHEEVVQVDDTEERTESTLYDRADQALDGLRQIAGTSGTLTALQLSNAVRLLARVQIALVRLVIRKFESAD